MAVFHKSDSKKNTIFGVIIILVGVYLMWVVSHSVNKEIINSNQASAYLLGLLLFVIGLVAIIFIEEVQIDVIQDKKRLVLTYTNYFNSYKVILGFDEIEKLDIAGVGKWNHRSYFLKIRTTKNKVLGTGIWSFDKEEVQEKANELYELIGHKNQIKDENQGAVKNAFVDRPYLPVIIALIVAFSSYMLWYRIKVGPLCPASWHGNLPVLFICSVFILVYRFLKKQDWG